MTFSQSIKSVFTKYVTFSGRASRSEFWYFVLFQFVVYAVFGLLESVSGSEGAFSWLLSVGYGLFGLCIFLPSLAVAVRRMHDIGKGGGWIFISLIPLIGSIWFIVLAARAGEYYTNRFGEMPY